MPKGPSGTVKLAPIPTGVPRIPAEHIARGAVQNMHPSLGKDLHDYWEYERETSAIPKVAKGEI